MVRSFKRPQLPGGLPYEPWLCGLPGAWSWRYIQVEAEHYSQAVRSLELPQLPADLRHVPLHYAAGLWSMPELLQKEQTHVVGIVGLRAQGDLLV